LILSTDQNHSFRKLLTASVLIYGGMLIYASLMPYDFMTEVNLKDLLYHNAWDHWPFNPKARISGSDLVSNLALYVPLGFLLATRCSLGRAGWVGSFLLTSLGKHCGHMLHHGSVNVGSNGRSIYSP
jgi:glycopeptide antibiotics resistance protein